MQILTRLAAVPILCLALAVGACSDSETAPTEHHTPVAARLFVNGTDVTSDFTLANGAASRITVKFYDSDNAEITGISESHFASLSFDPAGLATVSPVTGQHFQFDVTPAAAGTGTVTVGYGHDELADENSFGPFAVTVVDVVTLQ